MTWSGEVRRGDVFLVSLDPVVGSEQGGTRPVLVIQNDVGNQHSPVTIVAAITTKPFSKVYPTNVFLPTTSSGLRHDSTVVLNQLRSIDRRRLGRRLARLPAAVMAEVDRALRISLAL
ncbi:MAG: type II toxin-antitoxin system PemK/MazF family toxin [Candidatus Riflebacteria bacterium]|nr:type II toxin-antitoxin system PemK/MazF family toxin [Candidatus Riflebacteria bacterium]